MPMAARLGLLGAISLAAFSQTGCNMVPRNDLANAQNRTRQLYNQNKTMAMDRQGLMNENQRLQQELPRTYRQRAANAARAPVHDWPDQIRDELVCNCDYAE